MGFFEHISATDNSEQLAKRQALVIASKRFDNQFGAFLKSASGPSDFSSRLALVEGDIDEMIVSVANEYGVDAKTANSIKGSIVSCYGDDADPLGSRSAGIFDAVGDAASWAGNAVGDTVDGLGDAAGWAGNAYADTKSVVNGLVPATKLLNPILPEEGTARLLGDAIDNDEVPNPLDAATGISAPSTTYDPFLGMPDYFTYKDSAAHTVEEKNDGYYVVEDGGTETVAGPFDERQKAQDRASELDGLEPLEKEAATTKCDSCNKDCDPSELRDNGSGMNCCSSCEIEQGNRDDGSAPNEDWLHQGAADEKGYPETYEVGDEVYLRDGTVAVIEEQIGPRSGVHGGGFNVTDQYGDNYDVDYVELRGKSESEDWLHQGSAKHSATTKVAARRPKMCPYHSELTEASLQSGEPQYAAFSSLVGGPSHCKGAFEGKCNFKPEMVGQDFWDEKAKQAEERKQQRADQIENQPSAVGYTPDNEMVLASREAATRFAALKQAGDCNCWKGYKRVPGTEPCAPGSCEKCDSAKESSRRQAEVAWDGGGATKNEKGNWAWGHQEPKADESGLDTEPSGPAMDKTRWQPAALDPNGKGNLKPVDTEYPGSPNPTIQEVLWEHRETEDVYGQQEFGDGTNSVTDKQELPSADETGLTTEKNLDQGSQGGTFPNESQANPVTSSRDAFPSPTT